MIHIKRFLYKLLSNYTPNRSRTVRYAFPLTFVALALLGAAVSTSDTSSYIRIATNNRSVSAGETFSIDVYVSAHVPVNTVDIGVTFPESEIEIQGIDTGESVITLWTEDPHVEGNTVILRGGTFRKGFLGEHLIANINARAKEAGTAKFSVDDVRLLAGDGYGSTVTIEESGYESLTVYVGVDAPTDGEDATLSGTLAVGIYTDIDGDGDVDMADILAFMNAWRHQDITYDFNSDGRMTFVDFAIILAYSFFN